MSDFGSTTPMFRTDGTLDPDLDAPPIEGVRVVLEVVALILMTPLREVYYDESAGVVHPLQSLINSTLDDQALRRLEHEYAVAAEEQAECVIKAAFRIARTAGGFEIEGTVYTDEGPGALQVSASDVIKVLFPTVTA